MENLNFFDPFFQSNNNNSNNNNNNSSYSSSSSNINNDQKIETDVPFARRVREISNEDFLFCLDLIFENVFLSLKKAENLHKFIENNLHFNGLFIVVNNDDNFNNNEKNSNMNIAIDNKDCLIAACEVAQKSIIQLINLRFYF
jgi:hypothetical protein